MTSPKDCFGRDTQLARKSFLRNLTRALTDPEEEEARPELKDPSDTTDPEEEEARPDLKDPGTTTITAADTRTERCEVRQIVRRPVRQECYSGFIILRLTDKIVRRDEECPPDPSREQAPGRPDPPGADPPPADGPRFPKLWRKFPRLCEEGSEEGNGDEPVIPPEKIPIFECLRTLICECPPTELITVLKPAALAFLEQLAVATALPPLHSLTSYWRLDARHLPASLCRDLVALLNEFPEVDLAYREYAAFDPQAPQPPAPSFDDLQQYLDAAPLGIDARWAWRQGGGAQAAGTGVKLIDLEQGWFTHRDAPAPIPLIYGDNRGGANKRFRGDHGTAVLGQLIARDNGSGVTGIAPGADPMTVSHYRRDARSNGHVADAVVASVLKLRFKLDPAVIQALQEDQQIKRIRAQLADDSQGDVLLVEVQRSYRPAEVDHADFDALRLASALGVIVVEAAGNGAFDLDGYRDETGQKILDRGASGFRDSGAVLVGAAESRVPHDRSRFSNHGSRVDCHGWGDGVVTCGYGDLYSEGGRSWTYTRSFHGTSSAAPIVAGAAVLVQWLHKTRAQAPILPGEMRQILSASSNGTPQGPGVPGHVGVMPDVRAIVTRLGLVPVLYTSGTADASADIPTPSPKVIVDSGELRVELTNTGLDNPRVGGLLFWTDLSIVPTPDMWLSLPLPLPAKPVPPGGATTTLGPIVLPASPPAKNRILPNGSDGYFVLLQHNGAPASAVPPSPPYFDWVTFLDFLRQFRSFLTLTSNGGGQTYLPFLVNGAPDMTRRFQIEVLRTLSQAKVVLDVALALAADLGRSGLGRPVQRLRWQKEWMARFALPPRARTSVDVRLAATGPWTDPRQRRNGRYPCRLRVTGAKIGERITVRQLFENEEIGRITWIF